MGNIDIDEMMMILKWVLDCSDVAWIQVCRVVFQWWDLLSRVITLLA